MSGRLSGEDPKTWLKDFQEFMDSGAESVDGLISAQILERVKRDLRPRPWLVFLKLAAIHSVVGTLSLGLCSQFGVEPFGSLNLIMRFLPLNEWVCMMACGVLFVGLTSLGASMALKPKESELLRRQGWFQWPALALVSLEVLMLAGGEVVVTLGFFWLLGCVLGGLAGSELIWRFRRKEILSQN